MSSKYLVEFYFRTLLIGIIVTIFVCLFFEYESFTKYLFSFEFGEFFVSFIWYIAYGALIATVSQLVFFAYLFINPLGLSIFKSFWKVIQIFIIIVAIVDMVYLRLLRFDMDTTQIATFIWVPILIIITAIIVSYFKNKQSETNVIVPALFFMIVMTIVALIPFLKVDDTRWLMRSIFAILACNAFQLLVLPSYIKKSEQRLKARSQTKKEFRKKSNPDNKNSDKT